MPVEARRLLAALGAGYILAALGLGAVQFLWADSLAGDPRNPRLIRDMPAVGRGGILARDGEVIATGPGLLTREYRVPSLCHTVGYMDPRFGASGLEARYDRVLSGRDPRAAWSAWLAAMRGEPGRGGDLVTTIDLRIQAAAAAALGDRPGAVAVVDAGNGEILALVSRPGFVNPPAADSWSAYSARTDGPFFHRALQGRYPPGSTFKIVTAAAALSAGLDDFAVECRGRTSIGGRRFRDADPGGHGRVGLSRGLAVSCNVFFTQLGSALSAESLLEQARAFGLGEAPPLELETGGGLLPAVDSPPARAETAMGQGRLLVSPLQMALVAAAVVNQGLIVRPRLVRELRFGSANQPAVSRVWRRAISPEIAERLARDLVGAVRTGTGKRAAVKGLTVGGKTGTAEAPGGRPHAWFVGFASVGGRKLAVAAIVEHGGSGGAVAAPIAAAIWRAAGGEKD